MCGGYNVVTADCCIDTHYDAERDLKRKRKEKEKKIEKFEEAAKKKKKKESELLKPLRKLCTCRILKYHDSTAKILAKQL